MSVSELIERRKAESVAAGHAIEIIFNDGREPFRGFYTSGETARLKVAAALRRPDVAAARILAA